MRALQMIGREFGRLRVVSFAGRKEGRKRWRCLCLCGQTVDVSTNTLTSGHTSSCGCIHRQRAAMLKYRHGHARIGKTTSIYFRWQQMIRRCTDSDHPRYKDYGGRGIQVCARWLKFDNFLADMGNPPDGLLLDRINNDGNYEPGNCRWATRSESAMNTRRQKKQQP